MKYIVMPILKVLFVSFQCVAWIFMGLMILPLWCLWEWSLKPILNWMPDKGTVYSMGHIPYGAKPGYKYYYYKTGWDWIRGKRTYDYLKDEDIKEL